MAKVSQARKLQVSCKLFQTGKQSQHPTLRTKNPGILGLPLCHPSYFYKIVMGILSKTLLLM